MLGGVAQFLCFRPATTPREQLLRVTGVINVVAGAAWVFVLAPKWKKRERAGQALDDMQREGSYESRDS